MPQDKTHPRDQFIKFSFTEYAGRPSLCVGDFSFHFFPRQEFQQWGFPKPGALDYGYGWNLLSFGLGPFLLFSKS